MFCGIMGVVFYTCTYFNSLQFICCSNIIHRKNDNSLIILTLMMMQCNASYMLHIKNIKYVICDMSVEFISKLKSNIFDVILQRIVISARLQILFIAMYLLSFKTSLQYTSLTAALFPTDFFSQCPQIFHIRIVLII